MLRSNRIRLLASAALVACAAAMEGPSASADQRIQVVSTGNLYQCFSTHPFFGEAIAMGGIGNTVQCQVWTKGGTAAAQCPFIPLTHRARITRRDPNGALFGAPIVESAIVNSWETRSANISHSPADCPGTSITVASVGRNVP